MKKNIYWLFLVYITALLITGCSESQINNVNDAKKTQEQTKEAVPISKGSFVNEELAIYVAKQFANVYRFNSDNLIRKKRSKDGNNNKTIKHVLNLNGQNNKPALYLINYNNGGFAIISGDKHFKPMMAFSKKNEMPNTINSDIPSGLAKWLNSTVNLVDSARATAMKGNDTIGIHPGWHSILNTQFSSNHHKEPIGGGCEEEFIKIEPLLNTNWDQ